MPRTEAGKRLLALVNASPPIGELLPEAVDAIEAEAVAAERARIRAAVEELDKNQQHALDLTAFLGFSDEELADQIGWNRAVAEVLAIIDGAPDA